jgi:hypothetical protein
LHSGHRMDSLTPLSVPTDRIWTAKAAVTFAQFVTMRPFPGKVDFVRWEKEQALNPMMVEGTPMPESHTGQNREYIMIDHHEREFLDCPTPIFLACFILMREGRLSPCPDQRD